jgi:hypothetical protein
MKVTPLTQTNQNEIPKLTSIPILRQFILDIVCSVTGVGREKALEIRKPYFINSNIYHFNGGFDKPNIN